MTHGYEAIVYGRAARDHADLLITLARTGLPSEDYHYLQSLVDLVVKRTTLEAL